MADYSQQIADLQAAADICQQHVLGPVKGKQVEYPRWPNAWAACEIVWRNYLEMKTMDGDNSERDRDIVIDEARRLK
jgi:hypothetical protein